MNDDDEQFAADLRPNSVFGGIGSSDHFDDGDDDYEEYDDVYEPQGDVQGFGASPDGISGLASDASTAVTQPVAARQNGGNKLGAALTLFSIIGGGALGWNFGKFKGAAGGALAGGSLRNLYRGQKLLRTGHAADGIRMGGIGIAVLGVGSYLLWTANDGK